MIDPLIYFVRDKPEEWHMDINISKGWYDEVPDPKPWNTSRQRKAILAYQIRGTIPGAPGLGVPWGALLANPSATISDSMLAVQQAISQQSGGDDGTYTIPVIIPDGNGGIGVRLIVIDREDPEGTGNVGT